MMNILLDSGAFSAWRLGKPINIDEYCDFVAANECWISRCFNLDVINPAAPEEAANASFANLLRMRKQGLNPIPVFHVGEDISWLYRMLDLGCDYIALSASSIALRSNIDDWYAMAWAHLVDSQGKPLVHVHALGEGRIESMLAFPWKSVDSATWSMRADMSATFVLPGGVSFNQSRNSSSRASMNLKYVQGAERWALSATLAELGLRIEAFESDSDRLNRSARAFVEARVAAITEKRIQAAHPITFKPYGIFQPTSTNAKSAVNVAPFGYHLVLAKDWQSAAILAMTGYTNALTSFAFMSRANSGLHPEWAAYAADPMAFCASFANTAVVLALLKEYIVASSPM